MTSVPPAGRRSSWALASSVPPAPGALRTRAAATSAPAAAPTSARPGASSARPSCTRAAAEPQLPPLRPPLLPSSATRAPRAMQRWAARSYASWHARSLATHAPVGSSPPSDHAADTPLAGPPLPQCECGPGRAWNATAAKCECAHGLTSVNGGACNTCRSGYSTRSPIKTRSGAPVCDTCTIGYLGTSCADPKCAPCGLGGAVAAAAACPAECRPCIARGMKGYVNCRACKAGDSACNCLSRKLWNGSKCCECDSFAPTANP